MPLRIARSTERCFGRTAAMGPGPKRADTCTHQAPSAFGRSWRQQICAVCYACSTVWIDQANVTSRLLPCMRFDVYAESLVFLDNGHSSLLAAEGSDLGSQPCGK